MSDFLFASLQYQRHLLQTGEISAVELTQLYLEHNRIINPHINALVHSVDETDIIQQAQAADTARLLKNNIKPLTGIPITIKDSWETAGIISTSGTLSRKDTIPKQDATIVKRLRDAGAIILGKSNCPELVLPFETDNLVYGRTNNPWDLSRTPGGSTGGEAALIAAGGSPLGIAGDAAASIRTPAHFCGITGIKPTTGRVPRTGHFPQMGGISGPMASAGPMARTVDDLIFILPLLCCGDGIDPACVPVPYYEPKDVDVSQLRVAFHVDNGFMAADNDTAQAIVDSAKALEKMGATITEIVPDGMEASLDLFNGIFGADGAQRIQYFLQKLGTKQVSEPLQRLIDRLQNNELSTVELMTLLGRFDKLRTQMLGFMQKYDVILCPVAAHPAPKHGTLLGDDGARRLSYTITYNLVGYPSASVPVCLSSEGLPIGVQVIAGAWREDIVLATAKAIESSIGGYQKPPMDWL